MLNRLKDILRSELNEQLNRAGAFKGSVEDLEIDEILEKLKKQYARTDYQHTGNENTGGGHEQRKWSGESSYTDPQKQKEAVYYQNLEVPQGATFEEIKKSYRKLMKVYHPDLYHNDPEKFEMAQKVSSQLNEAYVYFEKKFGK